MEEVCLNVMDPYPHFARDFVHAVLFASSVRAVCEVDSAAGSTLIYSMLVCFVQTLVGGTVIHIILTGKAAEDLGELQLPENLDTTPSEARGAPLQRE